MEAVQSFDESEAYVLADNLETSCYLSTFLCNNNNIPLPNFEKFTTVESLRDVQFTANAEPSDPSWYDSEESDESDSDSSEEPDDSFATADNITETRDKSSVRDPVEQFQCFSTKPLGDGLCDAKRKACLKSVRFPPRGEEVSQAVECPWVQYSDDFHVLFYTAREIQQMRDAQAEELKDTCSCKVLALEGCM